MPMIEDAIIAFFLVVGGVFGLVGSYGLLKLRDTMQRLHAPTKATTLGVGGVLIASMLFSWVVEGQVSFHEPLVTVFLFLTAPISANFIAKVWMAEQTTPEDLPDTGGDFGWAVHDESPLMKEAKAEQEQAGED